MANKFLKVANPLSVTIGTVGRINRGLSRFGALDVGPSITAGLRAVKSDLVTISSTVNTLA